jgi:hypothetical protein
MLMHADLGNLETHLGLCWLPCVELLLVLAQLTVACELVEGMQVLATLLKR